MEQKILIVEDEDLLLQAIIKKMQIEGIQTVGCTSGEQAIDYLKNLEVLPTAIWLDYYLNGGMNGLEFLEQLSKNEKWKEIPIIVVSNTATEDKVSKMIALGASKYFIKAENKLEDMVKYIKDLNK
jgi:DNA-binding response OmpR family regulator